MINRSENGHEQSSKKETERLSVDITDKTSVSNIVVSKYLPEILPIASAPEALGKDIGNELT